MTDVTPQTEDWQTLPWKQFQRNVYRLQKRIYPYWAIRLGRHPELPTRVTTLLQRQNGKCPHCGLRFMAADVLEVHHLDGNHRNNRYSNWALLHGHCHDQVHGSRFC